MDTDAILKKILENRGLKTKEEIAEFFNPTHPKDIPSPFDSSPAIKIILSHIKNNNKIIIYGDYDVDGICSTAILWETIYVGYKNVFPHIPHRREEGYGLSQKGIDHCLERGAKLIIAVDNGITAHDQVKYCRDKGCDIIIIDHHETSSQLPNANCILHSLSTCAAGLTWFFCRDFGSVPSLELVALAVICDLVPLLGTNRSFAKYGLEELNKTTRPGLRSLFEESGIKDVGSYHVGFIIGPRLNAMGRLEHALDSLRLLCTKDSTKAKELAHVLSETNRIRQDLTSKSVDHALSTISSTHLIIAAHESYDEGIIGLIAAKLVEKYYRPAIAISVGEKTSKGSVRSIPGFQITDYLHKFDSLFLALGGHAMAAGFTIETSRIKDLVFSVSNPEIPPELLIKTRRVDCELELNAIRYSLYSRLKEFEPYGLGNPTPVFLTKDVQVSNPRLIGKNSNHLKFTVEGLDAIYFNAPPSPELRRGVGGEVGIGEDIVYSLGENTWNGQTKLQLVVKDIKSTDHEPIIS